jgi:hypothetical protein
MTLKMNPAIIPQPQATHFIFIKKSKGFLFYETDLFSPISYRKTHQGCI